MNRAEAVAAVGAAPLDPAAHAALGDMFVAAGELRPAVACYRSALALGGEGDELHMKAATGRDISMDGLDHNRFYRLSCLRDELRILADCDDFSLLDIGGGDGALALFLPDTAYQLIEPGTNGLGAEDLHHADNSVDMVCACHVYEHIPPGDREAFLDGLVRIARKHVLLLNPFAVEGGRHEERLQITVDLLNADWAREHLECGLPELDEVTAWAGRRGLTCRTKPNGATGTSFLATYVNHYARLAGRSAEADRINRYLNSLPTELLVAPNLPSAWFVHLAVS